MIELFNEDCLPAMKRYPDKYFDLCICDPPYGLGDCKTTSPGGVLSVWNKYKKIDWDVRPPDKEYFDKLFMISKNQIIWGCNYFPYYFGRGRIIWDKMNGSSTQSDCEIAYQSFTDSVRLFKFLWYGMLQHDMTNKEVRIHPTQKPVKLYEWLLKNYAKQGDKILDTHLGSGSIAVACYNLDFDLVGFEIDKDYYDGAVKRLEEHKKQYRLFDLTKSLDKQIL